MEQYDEDLTGSALKKRYDQSATPVIFSSSPDLLHSSTPTAAAAAEFGLPTREDGNKWTESKVRLKARLHLYTKPAFHLCSSIAKRLAGKCDFEMTLFVLVGTNHL